MNSQDDQWWYCYAGKSVNVRIAILAEDEKEAEVEVSDYPAHWGLKLFSVRRGDDVVQR